MPVGGIHDKKGEPMKFIDAAEREKRREISEQKIDELEGEVEEKQNLIDSQRATIEKLAREKELINRRRK